MKMKMPPSNSNQRKITNLLLAGACVTPQEGIGTLGTMNLSLAEIESLYEDLVMRGCAVKVGQRYHASEALLVRYGLIQPAEDPNAPRVPPRTMPPFKPLSRQNMPSSRGQREGSNDLKGVPSHYGRCTRETA
jgi:hypothetical protein